MDDPILCRVLVGAAVVAALASACTPSGAEPVSSPPTTPSRAPDLVRVAFFVDSSIPDSLELVASAQLAMQLRFDQAVEAGALPAGSTVSTLDTEGDPALAVAYAREAASDPAVVAAIEGPFFAPSAEAREVLAEAGLPIVSLSTLGRVLREGTWLRIVPHIETEARSIARLVAPQRRVCITGDDTVYSRAASRAVTRAFEMEGTNARHQARADLDLDRCSAVIWTGGAEDGAALARELRLRRPRVSLVMTDLARTRSFLEAVDAPSAVTGVCGCLDLTTTTTDRAATLVHDFQEAHGLPLGPYGVEGYDVGGLLADAIGPLGADRASVATGLRSPMSFGGVGGVYTVGSDRERSDPTVYTYRATATRWLPLGPG